MKRLLLALIAAALIANVVLVAAPARGGLSQTITWTSTADFDGGTKGSPTWPGSWSLGAPIPQAEGDGMAASYNGKVYVIGGASTSGPITYLNNTQIYNVAGNSWTSGAVMPTARLGSAIGVWADRIYIMGGEISGGVATNKTEYYNTTANTWATAKVMPVPTNPGICGASYPSSGVIFVLTGANLFSYSPSGDSWTTLVNPPSMSTWMTCGIVGGFLYSFYIVAQGVGRVSRYDIGAGTWTTAYDTNTPFVPFGGPKDNPTSSGLLWAGFGAPASSAYAWSPFFRLLYSYEPVSKTWTRQASAVYPRDGVSAAWSGGKFYVIGGRTNQSAWKAHAYNEIFSPTGSTSQNNGNVETSTDNPTVGAGVFNLTSSTGDTFATPSPRADTWKWQNYDDANYEAACAPTITGGALVYNLGDAALSSNQCTLYAAAGYTGDFDTSSKVSNPGGVVYDFQTLNEKCPFYSCTPTVDGFLIQVYNSPTHTVQAFTILNKVVTGCGPTLLTQPDPYWVRMNYTASTGTWGWWTSTDGIAWTNRAYCKNTVAGTLFPVPASQWNPGTTGTVSVSDFRVRTGTPAAGVYRSAGSWTSPLQTYAQQVPQQVTVDYSGATAAETISSLSVVDSTGAVISQYASAISSGSSFTWYVPFIATLRQDWSVKVALAGDGAGSVSVLDVIVQTGSPPGGAGGHPAYSLSCSFNPVLVSWTCQDFSDYTLTPVVNRTAWYYDGQFVGMAPPDGAITFRAVNRTWLSSPGNHTVTMVPWGVGPFDPYSVGVYESEVLAWAFLALIGLVLLVAYLKASRTGKDAGIYFVPFDAESARRNAISVDEDRKGWRTYVLKERDTFSSFRSFRGGALVYGVRPATAGEQERTGRKYVGEAQTFRERM